MRECAKFTSKLVGGVLVASLAVAMAGGNAQALTLESGTKRLDADLTEQVLVPTGVNAVLDLNGHNITAADDTIKVEEGAILVVNGSGVVTSTAKSKASLRNDGGTVTLNGGSFEKDKTGEWYVVANFGGKMTINSKATIKRNDSAGKITSSLVINGLKDKAEMIVNGGNFIGGNVCVKNDEGGTLTINNGNFGPSTNGAIQNWNIATINGGSFKNNEHDRRGVIHVGKYQSKLGADGITTINGGEFTGPYLFEGYQDKGVSNYPIDTPAKINGGTFNVKLMVNPTLDFGEAINNSVITGGTFTSDNIEVKPAEGYANYTDANGDIVVLPVIKWDTTDVNGGQLTVGDIYDLGLSEDVLKYATFAINPTDVATYADGKLTAAKPGTAMLTVELNGEKKVYSFTVVAKPTSQPDDNQGGNVDKDDVVVTDGSNNAIVHAPNTGLTAKAKIQTAKASTLPLALVSLATMLTILTAMRIVSKESM